jgi:hypothetical protein
MLEIFLIAFFSYKNYKIAQEKGLSPWKWVIRTIVWWLALDIAGMMIYINIIGIDPSNLAALLNNPTDAILATSTGVLSGFLGYLLVKKQLLQTS